MLYGILRIAWIFAVVGLHNLLSGCSNSELAPAETGQFDLVIAGGRVIDPETALDGVRHVGIRDGSIVAVSEQPLDDRLAPDGERIDATGLVVSPGFIDLHAHGQSAIANQYQAHDGVTTALELESGYLGIAEWLESRKDRAPIHYGASVAQSMARALAMRDGEERTQLDRHIRESVTAEQGTPSVLDRTLADSFYAALPEAAYRAMRSALEKGLREGGIGFGLPHQYTPGADRNEIFEVFRLAAEFDVPIFTHVRSMTLDAMQEVIANAAATGAPLHIVHVNSMSLGQLPSVLALIGGAQQQGLDVTTEAYPYTAGSTSLESAIFDDGWQEKLGVSYGDIQWEATGERLTRETFDHYRKTGGTVILHVMKEEWIELAMSTPFVMVASDGMPYTPGAHPRSAGTFDRVLGRYVRERGALDLATAIRKMTFMPAQRLQEMAPAMRRKGRIQAGPDADITIFDPESVLDTATFEEDLSFSQGIEHVIVLGTLVIKSGETVQGVFPGQPILGRFAEAH